MTPEEDDGNKVTAQRRQTVVLRREDLNMRNELIPDSKVEEAFDWLHANADVAAQAKAHRLYLESYSRTLKSRIMQEHDHAPISKQEREAYADLRYEEHLEGLKLAIERDEKLRWLKDAKLAEIDAWRTMQATQRAAKI